MVRRPATFDRQFIPQAIIASRLGRVAFGGQPQATRPLQLVLV